MVIIFDLDDTLYDESTFVKSGFKSVANYLTKVTTISNKRLYLRMLELLKEHGRGKVFDMILSEHSILTKNNVRKCLSIYRMHKPNIKLYPGARKTLEKLSSHKLYLATDGNKLVQTSKVKALGLKNLFDKIFITGYYGLRAAKPSIYCFEKIKKIEKCDWSSMVYIGDDPSKDFVNLNKIGVKTVRTNSGRHAGIKAKKGYDAGYKIDNINKFSISIFN